LRKTVEKEGKRRIEGGSRTGRLRIRTTEDGPEGKWGTGQVAGVGHLDVAMVEMERGGEKERLS
jgi:hypothetical protein